MTIRTQVILHAVFWSLAGLLLGYFLFPEFISVLHSYYTIVAEDSFSFANSDMGGQFTLHLTHSLSWATVPVLAFVTLWAAVRYKNRAWKASAFYGIFVLALMGYAFAGGLKVLRLGNTLDYKLPPDIKQQLNLEAAMLYDWGLAGAVLACVMYFLVIKKKQPIPSR